MDTPSGLIRLIQAYAAARHIAVTSACVYAAGQARLVDRLARGHDITTRRAARIAQWLSDHWPTGAEWPPDIPRPDPSPGAPAAAAPTPPPGDPVEVVKALRERKGELMDVMDHGQPIDWDAMQRTELQMLSAALRTDGNGEIASPNALCLALGVDRRVYDDVVFHYAGARGGAKRPRGADSDRRRVFDALIDAGDVRFARYRRGAAA